MFKKAFAGHETLHRRPSSLWVQNPQIYKPAGMCSMLGSISGEPLGPNKNRRRKGPCTILHVSELCELDPLYMVILRLRYRGRVLVRNGRERRLRPW